MYDYIDDNPTVTQYDIGYVNRVNVINRNPKVMAINSAVEIDLTGQVCADSAHPDDQESLERAWHKARA